MTKDQIDNNFSFHQPDEEKAKKHDEIREKHREVAQFVRRTCPDCRERSLAITKLEEASMWANAAIARN